MNFKKVIASFLICIILIITTAYPILADPTVIIRDNWGADSSISKSLSITYKQVNNIRVIEIDPPSREIMTNTTLWLRGLYYYFTSENGMPDIPFNYIVGWDGKVYQGLNGDIDAQVQSTDHLGTLVIAYLSDGTYSSSNGMSSLESVIKEMSNKYYIDMSHVFASDWTVINSNNSNTLQFTNTENALWQNAILNIKNDLGYKPPSQGQVMGSVTDNIQIPHVGTVSNVTFCPTSSCKVSSSQTLTVSVKLQNTGIMNIYSPIQFVADNSPKTGSYLYDSSWVDSNDTGITNLQSRIQPGQAVTLTFKIDVPSVKSHWSQSFHINANGYPINGTSFTVNLSNPQ
jgi:hypothetical protein